MIHLETLGVPTVYVVDEPFKADVQISCEKEGMSGLRRVIVPHPCGDISEDQLPNVISRLIAGLTDSLTEAEKSTITREREKPPRIIFKGNLEEVNRFFYNRGWTDGLPIIPPTEEKVSEMLQATSHLPDEIVTAGMLPESLTVTAENVATVGVMSGCEPKYMPVLLSIVEAFANDVFSSSVRSTTSFSFAIVVNGPIVKQIGMNSGMNAMGSGTGNKANASIGRFLRLAIICLGGSKTGLNDMSSQGNPSKYSFAFAENEELSPWEPFHVSSGFKREQSVVSILSGGWNHSSPFGNANLEQIAKSISTYELPTGALVIMDPMSAKKVSGEGYTKQAAEEHIWSYALKTIGEFKADFFYPLFIEPVLKGKSWYGRKHFWPTKYLELPSNEKVQIFPRGDIRIVVVGGETNPFSQVWQMARPSSVVIDKWK